MPEPEVVADWGHAAVKRSCLTGRNVQELHQILAARVIMGNAEKLGLKKETQM